MSQEVDEPKKFNQLFISNRNKCLRKEEKISNKFVASEALLGALPNQNFLIKFLLVELFIAKSF